MLCNSTRAGMPKVFKLEGATGVGAQTRHYVNIKMNRSIIKEYFHASSFIYSSFDSDKNNRRLFVTRVKC